MTKRFRSANIHEGMLRAPTRAFLHALGQDDDEIARPHIGVFHTGGEMSPCNMLLPLWQAGIASGPGNRVAGRC